MLEVLEKSKISKH